MVQRDLLQTNVIDLSLLIYNIKQPIKYGRDQILLAVYYTFMKDVRLRFSYKQ